MSIKILTERHRVTEYTYDVDFSAKDNTKASYAFPCNEQGELLLEKLSPAALENYKRCSTTDKDLYTQTIQKYKSSYVENAVGLCTCGKEVVLSDDYLGACQCGHCGQWYNMFGQELVAPSLWEEELEEDY